MTLDQVRIAIADGEDFTAERWHVVCLFADLDAAQRRARAAEDRAEMAAHDARWGTR